MCSATSPTSSTGSGPRSSVTAAELLDVASATGGNTEAGLRSNLEVAVAYTAVWLSGNGAVGIHNLMEDAATAEISRSQVWQQIKNGWCSPTPARPSPSELVAADPRRGGREAARRGAGRAVRAATTCRPSTLIADLCLSEDFTDFLTLPAYELVK